MRIGATHVRPPPPTYFGSPERNRPYPIGERIAEMRIGEHEDAAAATFDGGHERWLRR